ncbi:MAG: D-alanyl-D-alanine carboxypeptidase family protein [Candidatus Microbacterium colombiense]|nr:MAG: D-alanyl-D-alanine carboxypeptidase family protein [Microbacterium sp.]
MGGTAGVIVNLGGGRGLLREAPAKSLARIDRALGHRMQITEALRSWSQQNEHYQTFLRYGRPIAKSPDGPPKGDGPSIHQLGYAIDSDEAQEHQALMEDHGWRRTVYRWVDGVWTLIEGWHFEYDEARDNHRHEVVTLVQTASGAWHLPNPNPPALPEPEIGDIEMRMIWNGDDPNEETKRALVGELTFQRLSPRASTRERKLFGKPVDVNNAEYDGFLGTVNARRASAGLKPLPNPRTS